MIRCCCSRCLGAVLFIDADAYLGAHTDGSVQIVVETEAELIAGEVLLSQRRHPSNETGRL